MPTHKGKGLTGNAMGDTTIGAVGVTLISAIVRGLTPSFMVRTGVVAAAGGVGAYLGEKYGYADLGNGALSGAVTILLQQPVAVGAEAAGLAAKPEEGTPFGLGTGPTSGAGAGSGAVTPSTAAVTAARTARLASGRAQLATARASAGSLTRSGNTAYNQSYAAGFTAASNLANDGTAMTFPAPAAGNTPASVVGYFEGAVDQMAGRTSDPTRYAGANPPAPAHELPSGAHHALGAGQGSGATRADVPVSAYSQVESNGLQIELVN